MAQMICRYEDCENKGEQEFFQACERSLDDRYVVYHNRHIDGLEFDFCILAPQCGLIVVEIKAWNEETFLGYRDGQFLIRTEEKSKREDPFQQVNGYFHALNRLLRNELGSNLRIGKIVCFTHWNDAFLNAQNVVTYCGGNERYVMGQDDLNDPERFVTKLQNVFKNGRFSISCDAMDEETVIRVRDVFDPGYAAQQAKKQRQKDTETIRQISLVTQPPVPAVSVSTELSDPDSPETPDRVLAPYSVVAILPDNDTSAGKIDMLIDFYANGTKVTVVFENASQQQYAADKLNALYCDRTITVNREGELVLDETSQPTVEAKTSIRLFNWTSVIASEGSTLRAQSLFVLDGKTTEEEKLMIQQMDQEGLINQAQYEVEHENVTKHILVRAGAGTGKTSVMIDRIAFLISQHRLKALDLKERIIMMTFTDAAAENMCVRLGKYFQNMFLLTGKSEYLAMSGKVNTMQISTIHSYALMLIKRLCAFTGYSHEVTIESGKYNRQLLLEETLEEYIQEKLKKDSEYLKNIPMPLYEIRKKLFTFVTQLENKSVNLTDLRKERFGSASKDEDTCLHDLLIDVIGRSEVKYAKQLKENGKIYLGSLIPVLKRAVTEGGEQLKLDRPSGQDRYMFVDEFQDTDDEQILTLLEIARVMDYHLFCVGDLKQCIYRFRGAEEMAFDKLNIEEDREKWAIHSLVHNYRTDDELLKAFEPYFIRWGREGLLSYDPADDRLDDPIHSNDGRIPEDCYMHRIVVSDQSERMEALFGEIRERQKLIESDPEHHQKKDRMIAILVRENWQVREITRYASEHYPREFLIRTVNGGDLFQTEAAMDMLTLVQALCHEDAAYLSHLAESNLFGGHVKKAYLQKLGADNAGQSAAEVQAAKVRYLKGIIDRRLSSVAMETDYKSLDEVKRALQLYPVMQVIHQLYMQLAPWQHAVGDPTTEEPDGDRIQEYSMDEYRMNVDEIFERFIRADFADGASINTLNDYLSNCIFSQKEAESRHVERENDENTADICCLTVHKSKGLEYGYVILPYTTTTIDRLKKNGMDTIVYPDQRIGYSIRCSRDNDEKEITNNFFDKGTESGEREKEETRVLYVAMTRARKGFSWIEEEKNRAGNNWQKLLKKDGN